jgi:hypothetical protein
VVKRRLAIFAQKAASPAQARDSNSQSLMNCAAPADEHTRG